jgi:hypothetical protein
MGSRVSTGKIDSPSDTLIPQSTIHGRGASVGKPTGSFHTGGTPNRHNQSPSARVPIWTPAAEALLAEHRRREMTGRGRRSLWAQQRRSGSQSRRTGDEGRGVGARAARQRRSARGVRTRRSLRATRTQSAGSASRARTRWRAPAGSGTTPTARAGCAGRPRPGRRSRWTARTGWSRRAAEARRRTAGTPSVVRGVLGVRTDGAVPRACRGRCWWAAWDDRGRWRAGLARLCLCRWATSGFPLEQTFLRIKRGEAV